VSCSRRRTRVGVGGSKISPRTSYTSLKRWPVTSRIAGQDRRCRLPFGRWVLERRRRDSPGATRHRDRDIEGLYLSGVEPGEYELICLPLKVEGATAHLPGRSCASKQTASEALTRAPLSRR
jgi:hypothetical protein